MSFTDRQSVKRQAEAFRKFAFMRQKTHTQIKKKTKKKHAF